MSLLGHDEITRRFAESLERIRIERGISQTVMAKYLDLSLSGYRKLLAGDILKVDIYHAYRIHELTGMWLFELLGFDDDNTKIIREFKKLSHHQKAYIAQLIRLENAFFDQTDESQKDDYVSLLIPTGNFGDAMNYDSLNIEHINVSKYRPMYGAAINCAVKVTSNHLHPVYHTGDVLLICCEPPREGDTGIFINTKSNRVYLRKFRQGFPCRLESIVNEFIPPILVDPTSQDDMSQWVKFGYVLTKMR